MEYLSLYSKIVFFVAYTMTALGFIIFLGTKDKGSRALAIAAWATALWVVSRGIFHGVDSAAIATEVNKISFFLGNVIGVLMFRFAYMFPDNKEIPRYLKNLLFLSVAAFIPFFMQESIAVGPVFSVEGIQRWGWEQGPWLPLHDLHFVGLTTLALIYLYRKIRTYSSEFRRNFFLTLGIVIIGVTPTIIATNILPRFFNVFQYDWISSLSMVVWISMMSYAIIRYNQMNTKTVVTEILVFAALGLLFVNIFI